MLTAKKFIWHDTKVQNLKNQYEMKYHEQLTLKTINCTKITLIYESNLFIIPDFYWLAFSSMSAFLLLWNVIPEEQQFDQMKIIRAS